MRAPTTAVICTTCGRELRGTECPEGFRIRHHLDTATERRCRGAFRLDHQPVIVFHHEALAHRVDAVTQRFVEIVRDRVG